MSKPSILAFSARRFNISRQRALLSYSLPLFPLEEYALNISSRRPLSSQLVISEAYEETGIPNLSLNALFSARRLVPNFWEAAASFWLISFRRACEASSKSTPLRVNDWYSFLSTISCSLVSLLLSPSKTAFTLLKKSLFMDMLSSCSVIRAVASSTTLVISSLPSVSSKLKRTAETLSSVCPESS